LLVGCAALLSRDICTLVSVGGETFLLVLTVLFGNIFAGLTVIVGRFALFFISSFTDLLIFAVVLGHFFALFVINSLAVLFWGLDAFLRVGGPTILLGDFSAFFVVNGFTVLLWNLGTFLGITGAALFVISAFVFVDCLALLCGDILTLVVVHSAALLTVGRLALFLSPGLTGSHVVEATATTTLESLQSLADDSKGVDWART